MLTRDDLNRLAQDLRDQQVLSVYVGATGSDIVERRRWRLDLRHSLDDIASWLRDAPHADRELFETLRKRVETRLAAHPADVAGPGWVGFFTAAGPDYEDTLPVNVPTMAVWSTGASVAPYVRIFRETTPVIVAIVDSKSARVYRYAAGTLAALETLAADLEIELPRHMGRPSPQGFHTGTRGRTGTDAAQDILNHATHELIDRTAVRLSALAGTDGWIVVGGSRTLPPPCTHDSVRNSAPGPRAPTSTCTRLTRWWRNARESRHRDSGRRETVPWWKPRCRRPTRPGRV